MATAAASHPAQQKDRTASATRCERASPADIGRPQWKHVCASTLEAAYARSVA
jgi:hypothetical protein